MNADILAFRPPANDKFDDEPDAPYPSWLWVGYFRNSADVPLTEPASPTTRMAHAVVAYLAVWFLASLSASACVITLAALFH